MPEPPAPPELERFLGLARYATATPGVGGRLRSTPEDFVVEEIPRPPAPAQGEGKYTIATLRATNWETNRLVRELGRSLGISRKGIFFTGTKDKRAVKTQQMALLAPEAKVRELRIPGLEVLATFRADRAPKLGDLVGNRFDIAVREVEVGAEEAARRCAAIEGELRAAGGVPNYFGLQRFGALRPVTQRVGERIVRGDFEGAVMAYVGEPQKGEPAEAFEARSRIQQERDFGKALTYYPSQLSFEHVLVRHLAKSPGDWVGALRQLPLNLATMFVYAYQSLVFNRIVAARLAADGNLATVHAGDILLPVDPEGVPDHDTLIPVREANLAKCAAQVAKGRAAISGLVFGLEAPFAGGPQEALERRAVEEEGLQRSDFAIPDMPELASFGQRRALAVQARDFRWAAEAPGGAAGDAAGAGAAGGGPAGAGIALRFTFRLPKGSYATCLLREFMKSEAHRY